jgi:hypothetical protein
MKSSLAMSIVFSSGFHALSTRESAHAFGVVSFATAVRRIFWPCSSVPVSSQVSSPA